jgi:hypothetical protein
MSHYYIQRFTIDVAVPGLATPLDYSADIAKAIEALPYATFVDMEIDDRFIHVDGDVITLSENAGTPANEEEA